MAEMHIFYAFQRDIVPTVLKLAARHKGSTCVIFDTELLLWLIYS